MAGVLGFLAAGCWNTTRTREGDAAPDPLEPDSSRATITDEDIDRRQRGEPLEKVIQANVPGVTVRQNPDGSISVRVRGTTSIYGNKEPLYVIDGVPVNPGPSGGVTGIQISEIAKIEVLKDPVSTTMWGLRGANGVILITLKPPGH